jgi:hypothetical protein
MGGRINIIAGRALLDYNYHSNHNSCISENAAKYIREAKGSSNIVVFSEAPECH